MAESDSDDRRPFAERSDGESVDSSMLPVEQTQGDERAPEGKSPDDKKLEDKNVKLEVKLEDEGPAGDQGGGQE
eukprot:4046880-Pyramimonas_sp.AAC.1